MGGRPEGTGDVYTAKVVWELLFLMVVLKLPIAYLCAVVYWAIKAEPDPFEGAALTARVHEPSPDAPCPWSRPVRRRSMRPSGGRPGRAARVARARLAR